MRLLILAVAMAFATSASAVQTYPSGDMPLLNPNAGAPSTCPPTSRYEAARRGGKLPPSVLSQLPAADMYNAVYRRVGRCEVPMIVRYNVGGPTQNRR